MKKSLVWIVISFVFVLTGCGAKEEPNGTHMNIIEGKVVEIRNKNEVLLAITKERGGYKKEDRVLVHYEKCELEDLDNLEAGSTTYTPVVNDIIGLQFWPQEVTKKEGYDYIEGSQVSKYINN